MKHLRRLPLDEAGNVRDLGGYAIGKKASTKWRCFLRSDDISTLNESDEQYLKDYGLTSILDLRSEEEVKRRPDTLMESLDITYKHTPLMVQGIGDVTQVKEASKDFTLANFYLGLLKHKAQVKVIMETIASLPEGTILFHCSAGKDRTGVVAMLLLGLVGVARQDIITNYEQTFTNLRYKTESHSFHGIPDKQMKFMYSAPEYLEPSLEYIEHDYGSFEHYLRSCDIKQEVLNAIKDRFIEA